jgi:hypothetical protein
MADGREVWFRAPQREINRLVELRHGKAGHAHTEKEHLILTEKEVPIAIDLSRIRSIHIT